MFYNKNKSRSSIDHLHLKHTRCPYETSLKWYKRPLSPLFLYTNIINLFLSNIPRDEYTAHQRKIVYNIRTMFTYVINYLYRG